MLICVVISIKANEYRIISGEEVIDTAYAQLDIWLEKIRAINYNDFGFNTIEEMNRVELGTPYEVIFVSEDFLTDSVFIKEKNYFIKENQKWEVPLLVDSEMRCLLSVGYFNDSLNVFKIGGAANAKEIQVCMDKYNIPKEGKKYIFIPEYLYLCDFIMHFEEDKNNYQLFPIIENTIDWECNDQVSYNKHDSLEGFYYSYQNNVYNSISNIANDVCPFEIYPNPVVSQATLSCFVPITIDDARLQLIDENGILITEQFIDEREYVELKIDATNFPKNGIYFFRLILDESVIRKRVLIAK